MRGREEGGRRGGILLLMENATAFWIWRIVTYCKTLTTETHIHSTISKQKGRNSTLCAKTQYPRLQLWQQFVHDLVIAGGWVEEGEYVRVYVRTYAHMCTLFLQASTSMGNLASNMLCAS